MSRKETHVFTILRQTNLRNDRSEGTASRSHGQVEGKCDWHFSEQVTSGPWISAPCVLDILTSHSQASCRVESPTNPSSR